MRQELPGSDQSRYLADATELSDRVFDDLSVDSTFYRQFEMS
jgi:hypothetical protein